MFKKWLKAALMRAIRTVAQAALGCIGTGVVGIGEIDWKMVCSISLMAGIASLLQAIAGLPEVKEDGSK